MTLAREGRTSVRVVLAADAIPAERTAAEELASYLERVTSARFPLVDELGAPDGPGAIWVGPTARARHLGIDVEDLGPEQWRIRTDGEDLVLVGGRPRGTLYAVYRFLEDHVGVRWWTTVEEHVPFRPDLEIDADATGRPAFAYRDIHGVRGSPLFHAHNRANGHYSFLAAVHGGNEGYGPPSMVHTFYMYVPPEEYFAVHPEFYAERDGARTGERAQLCLTNDALVEVVVTRMKAYIEQARAEAEATGEQAPRLFDFSQNDWRRPCTCARCREVDRRQGSHAGSLVQFVNRVANAIAESHPDVLIDTLAYGDTLAPPRGPSLRANVVVRLADLFHRDFSRPVTDRANRKLRRAIEGWTGRTSHLRIWAYTVTFGRGANLPLPTLRVMADDFRHYREQGVEGLFVQHDREVRSDMRDLKVWVLFKLVEDPTRDVEALVVDFTDGYYGPAGATIREYLQARERAVSRRRPSIGYPAKAEDYRHLTPEFLRRAQSLFDRAEREVVGRPDLLPRLRQARISLDRATLLRWDEALARPAREAGEGDPIDPAAVAERYREAAYLRIEIHLEPHRGEELRGMVDRDVARLRSQIHR
jgi:hypothetical protein